MRTSHLLILCAVFLLSAAGAAFLFVVAGDGDAALEGPLALNPSAGRAGGGAGLAGAARPAGDTGRVVAGGAAPTNGTQGEVEAAPLPALVVGRVVGPDGAPLAGAQVLARDDGSWTRLPLELEGQEGDRWSARVETSTGEDGRFVFREGLDPGALRLVARAPGFAPQRLDNERLPDRPPLDLGDVRLERAVVLAGRVVDRGGAPVAGAQVLQAVERGVAGMEVTVHGKGIPLGETDAKGRFRLDQVPHGPWRLLFDAQGFLVHEEAGRSQAPGEVQDDLIVVLERGDSIAGRVIDIPPALRAAPLRVEARPLPEEGGGAPSADVHRRARVALVGLGGAFEIRGVAGAGRFQLTVWTEQEGRWTRAPRAGSAEAYAGARGVELGFRAETAFSVRIVDASSGAPVTDFVLWAGTGGRNRLAALKRDDDSGEALREHPDGRARYGGLQPPREGPMVLRLRVRAAGYADLVKEDIVLERDTDNDLGTLALTAAPTLLVTVVASADGAPIEGARVYLAESGSDSLQWYRGRVTRSAWSSEDVRYAETDASGLARVPTPGAVACDVCAAAEGFVPCAVEPIGLQPGAELALLLELDVGAAVTARVRDERARPVAGVKVLARAESQNGAPQQGWDAGWDLLSDAEGVARFEHLPPGNYRFAVEPEATGGRWQGVQIPDEAWQFMALVDGDDALVELQAPARGLLRGRLTEAGEPLAAASLRLSRAGQGPGRGGDNPRYTALTTHEGLFGFEGVSQGEYELTIGHPERTMGFRTEVTVGTREELLEINLPLSMIEGRVTDTSGAPLAGVDVRVDYMERSRSVAGSGWSVAMVEDANGRLQTDWGGGAASRAQTRQDGTYRLRGLAVDGHLRVSVRGDFVTPGAVDDIALAPDEIRRNVDFVLERAGQIELRISGGRESRYRAIARPADEPDSGGVRSALYRSRRVVLGPCLPGEWTLIVERYEGEETVEVERRALDVRADETTRLELSLP
jgi:protocatechuate 3,4-dioxygenase beta subunit